MSRLAVFIINNWNKIGKISIEVINPDGELSLQPEQAEVLRVTVASPRLDAVLEQTNPQGAYCLENHCLQGKAVEKGLTTYANDPDRYP